MSFFAKPVPTFAGHALARLIARSAGAFAAAALLVGCAAATGGNSLTVFADPGKYQFSSCEHLAVQRKTWGDKEQELRLLMDKAEQGNGGAVVNLLAYRADYAATTEELKVIENASRAKNCSSWQSNSAVR
jgi:hypothetical protein